MRTTAAFSLDTDDDADIVVWLSAQGNKSAAVRQAIRASWLRDSVTLGDVLNAVGEVKRLLRSGVVVNGNAGANDDGDAVELTPEERAAQAALDGLGL